MGPWTGGAKKTKKKKKRKKGKKWEKREERSERKEEQKVSPHCRLRYYRPWNPLCQAATRFRAFSSRQATRSTLSAYRPSRNRANAVSPAFCLPRTTSRARISVSIEPQVSQRDTATRTKGTRERIMDIYRTYPCISVVYRRQRERERLFEYAGRLRSRATGIDLWKLDQQEVERLF